MIILGSLAETEKFGAEIHPAPVTEKDLVVLS